MSLKGFRNWLQKLSSESLFRRIFSTIFGFSSIFGQLLLFDHKQLCIEPFELSEHYEPGNHSETSRKSRCQTAWM